MHSIKGVNSFPKMTDYIVILQAGVGGNVMERYKRKIRMNDVEKMIKE